VKVVATRMVFAIADFLPGFMTRSLSDPMLRTGPILPEAGIAGASPRHRGASLRLSWPDAQTRARAREVTQSIAYPDKV
jgi:hypothetical protein